MSGHEEFQEEIAASAAGRLEGGARDELEAHLAVCRDCADLAATWRAIAAGIRDSDDGLLGAHPAPSRLRRYAMGDPGDDLASLARHLESCPSCELEVSVWRTREVGLGPGSSVAFRSGAAGGRHLPLRALGGTLAAGLLIGFGIAALFRPTPRGADAPGPQAPAVATPWSGPVRLLFLDEPLRGGADVARFRIAGTAQPWVLIAVRPTAPEGAAPDDLFRFEILDTGRRTVWSVDVRADQIEEQLESTEVVTLAVPTTSLPAGRYEMSVRPVTGVGGPLLLQVPFEIIP